MPSSLARRSREGAFPESERDRAFGAIEADMAAMLIAEEIVARARTLLLRHVLRVGDSIQPAASTGLTAWYSRHAFQEACGPRKGLNPPVTS
jgi:hypothetical protein